MYYVYILKDKFSKLYIGYSSDLRRRLSEHQRHIVDATKNMQSCQLVYYEAYQDKVSAQERERSLKQFGSAYAGLLKRIGFK